MVGGLVYQNDIFIILAPIVFTAMGVGILLIFKKRLLFLLILFFVIGLVSFKIENTIIFSGEVEKSQALCQGRVAENTGKAVILDTFTIDGKSYKGKMALNVPTDAPKGYIIEFTADIVTNDVDVFDTYKMSKYYDKVFYNANKVRNVKVSYGSKKALEKVKDKLNDSMLDNMPDEEGGVAVSLVFGDTEYITRADSQTMRNTGLSHIFSVSGLHVGFLVALIIFIGKKLRLSPSLRFVIVFTTLVLYGLLTGFPSGVKRAGIMSLVYLLGIMTGRKNDALNTLAMSVFIIVLLTPRELFDISFLMSVSAIFGMVCFYSPLKRWIQGKSYKKFRKYIASSIAATISANVFLVPISCNVFNTFATYQLISNLTLLPLVTFVYTALMPVLAISYFFSNFGRVNMLLSYFVTILRLVASAIEKLPFATLEVSSMGKLTILYIALAIGLSPFIKKSALLKPLYNKLAASINFFVF